MGETEQKREETRARREDFVGLCSRAFDRMFGLDGSPDHLRATFLEREEKATGLGKELAGFLLEQHVQVEPGCHPISEPGMYACPRCAMLGTPAKDEAGEPITKEFEVETELGMIEVKATAYRCSTCGRLFFPLKRDVGS